MSSRTVPLGEGYEHTLEQPVVAALTTTQTVLVSVGASVLISLVLTGLFLLLRNPKGTVAQERIPDDRLSRVVADLTTRMDAMGRELQEALARTHEEGRRSRVLGELAATIDLDEVLNRTLDAAGALPGVDAALIHILGPGDEPITKPLGITNAEAADYSLGKVPSGRKIRVLTLDFGETGDMAFDQKIRPIHAGLAVPIQGEEETLGLLNVYSRSAREFDGRVLTEMEALALRAGPAIQNARRFREARHQADLDALTGLHNRRYFHETLARETARAQRYNRRLALIVFDLDNFKSINDRIGHLAGDSVLAEVAERVREVVRHADIACRVGGDEFAVILPESTLDDAEQLYRRIQAAVSSRPISHAGQLLLSAGIAELRAEDEPNGFFERADEALYGAKEAGKGRVASEPGGTGIAAAPPVAPPPAYGIQGE